MNRCQICNGMLPFSKNHICNTCADRTTEIIFNFEKDGHLEKTDNDKLNLFIKQVINSRKNQVSI